MLDPGWAGRLARAALIMLGELQVVGRAGQPEQDAPVAGMAVEPADLGQSEALTVEAHDVIQLVGGARDSHVPDRQHRRPGQGGHDRLHLRLRSAGGLIATAPVLMLVMRRAPGEFLPQPPVRPRPLLTLTTSGRSPRETAIAAAPGGVRIDHAVVRRPAVETANDPGAREALAPGRVPLFCDTALAGRIERAEAQLITGCCEAARRRTGAEGFAIPIAGGVASFAGEGSPFNKVAGLGFAGRPARAAIDDIEKAFLACGSPVQIELAHLADPELGRLLTERGYLLESFENVLGRDLA